MPPRLPQGGNQFMAPIPAHRFRQGGRDVYYFALDLATLDGLLPHRVDESMIKQANRRLTPSHAKRIQSYLESRDDWLLGAMLLGIAPDALEFEPYVDESGKRISESFGELRIRSRRTNTMRIFDGQHRRRAIQDTLTQLETNEGHGFKLAALLQASVPIVLYAEDNMAALRQMFSDASKTKRIEANVVAQFDQRDAFNRAATFLAEQSDLFGGRVEMNRTTVALRSQRLISINQLAETLKTLVLGYSGRNSRARNSIFIQDIDELFAGCLSWADEFMPAARTEYAGLAAGDIANEYIPLYRTESLAYSTTFMRILAGCHYNWRSDKRDWGLLTAFVRDASLEPGSGRGALLVDAGVVAVGGQSLFARRQEVDGAIKYIVEQARIGPLDSAGHEAGTTYSPSNRRLLGRAPGGQITREADYVEPILQALIEMGGSGETAKVVSRVGEIMKPILTQADLDPLPSNGEPRWQKSTNWARFHMVENGLLLPTSPHGIWDISEKGRGQLISGDTKTALGVP